jgi:hypothetical protein
MSHQPDRVSVGGESTDSKFKPHPAGTFAAVCVDVIDLGKRVGEFQGKVKVSPKLALVFRTGERREDGEPFDISAEFTASMFDKATLRHFLESWRGRAYSEEQITATIPIDKLVGQPAFLNILHEIAKSSGRTYARIATVMPLPKGMARPEVGEYSRPAYWAERKAEYLEAYRKHEAANAPPVSAAAASFGDMPEALADDDDGLPF